MWLHVLLSSVRLAPLQGTEKAEGGLRAQWETRMQTKHPAKRQTVEGLGQETVLERSAPSSEGKRGENLTAHSTLKPRPSAVDDSL